MLRIAGLCLFATLLLPVAAQAEGETLRWSARPTDRGRVQLQIRHERNNSNQDWAPQELQGLDTRFPGGPLSFRITRDAGTLTCSGTGRGGRGEGECRVQRRAAFFDSLAQRGIRVGDDWNAWQLMMFDVKLALLDELKRQDYDMPSVKDLVTAGIFKLDAAFLRELDAAGYRRKDLDDLIPLRIHNITPAFIREVRAANPRLELPVKDLVALRIHGVTPEWIAGWRALGYDLTPGQLTTTRIHNISPDYARGILAQVRDKPTLDQFVRMRIHGVRSEGRGGR
jgi:hypothetical protein